MKKTILYCAVILTLGFTSCEDKSDLGMMQVNPQETLMAPGSVAVSPAGAIAEGKVNLDGDFKDGIVPLITYSVGETFPSGATLEFDVDLAGTEDFANAVTVRMDPIPGVDGTYGVKASEWDDAFRRLLGKSPYAKDNYLRIACYALIGEQRSRIAVGDRPEDIWFASSKVNVTPVDLHINVEEAYYLVGTQCDWKLENSIRFEHSDLSQYDDPVFTLAVDIPAELADAGWWWKIVPQSAFETQDWNGVYGPEKDGDSSLKGVLYKGGQAGALKVAGQYLFTINMLDCTYEVTQAIPMLYTPGGGNGWNFTTGMLDTYDFSNYFGFAHLNGEFKITDRPEWGGIEWGAGDAEGSIKQGGGNISGPADGLYWMNVNISNLTFSTKAIDSIGVIGSFPGNNWVGNFVELKPTDDILVWTAEITFTDASTEWKFRTNGAWEAPNLGNEYDHLTNDGANLKAPGVGTYDMTLDLREVPYKVTFAEKK